MSRSPSPEPLCSREMMRMMLEQQKMFIAALTEQRAPQMAGAEASFHVMPDLTKQIGSYNGEGTGREAKTWLRGLNSMAALHRWPDTFKLESARMHLTGAARHWYLRRQDTITTWEEFENQFRNTFVGTASMTERWKMMTDRKQKAGESTLLYFHEKMRLCTEVDLDFAECKDQVMIGLRSRELCTRLSARDHRNEDELFNDLKRQEMIEAERRDWLGTQKREGEKSRSNTGQAAAKGATGSSATTGTTGTTGTWKKTGTTDPRPPVRNDKGEPKCYNCDLFGHLARDCTSEKKVRYCLKCKTEGHTQRHCTVAGTASGETTVKKEALLVQDNASNQENLSGVKFIKEAKINGHKVRTLIDTGSAVCLMRQSDASKLGLPVTPAHEEIYAYGNVSEAAIRATGKVVADIEIDDTIGQGVEILIVPDGAQAIELIIGRTWTEQPQIAYLRMDDNLHIGYRYEDPFRNLEIPERDKIVLRAEDDFTIRKRSVQFVDVKTDAEITNDVIVGGAAEKIGQLHRLEKGKMKVPLVNEGNTDTHVRQGEIIGRAELSTSVDENVRTRNSGANQEPIERSRINVDPEVTPEQLDGLVDLLNEFRDCFAFNLNELGCTDLIEVDIEEIEGSQPFNMRPYRVSREDRETIREIVTEWKDAGIVSETSSPYANPVLLVRKKNGEPRLVVDLRRLNKQTVKQVYPIPVIDDQLELLAGSTIFSVLDLAHGYLQIPLAEKAKAKTAFITPDDTGEFNRMIFGLTNAPYHFARLMHVVLGELKDKIAMCYMDDLLIPARSWEEMMERVRRILEAMQRAKLTLKLTKCEFGRKEIEYLGFIVSKDGIRPGRNKIGSVETFPVPTNVHEVRRFLGLTGFFRRFVRRYALVAEPLSRLTKKGVEFEWTDRQQQAMDALKKALTTEPVLALYDPKARTELHTDACAAGLAGMLLQEGPDGKLHLVYCVSKKTTPAECNYHSSKLELMAIVWSLERLRQFLIGISFVVVTDCQALVYLNTAKTTNAQAARWFSLIQEFDMTVRHRPGTKMAHIDAISRGPSDPPEDTLNELIEGKIEVYLTCTEAEQVAMMQQGDDELKGKMEILKKPEGERTAEESGYVHDLVLERGILYKKITEGDHSKYLFVIPKTMRKSMVVKAHDLMGHFGLDRTVAKIQERYWFSGMRRYVRGHLKACFECLMSKVPSGRQAGLLNPIPSGRRPFEVIHLDHLGPFITSNKQNRHLLVLVDNMTKFVKLYAVRDTSTRNILRALGKFEMAYGLPETIITDRGTGFTAKDFEKHCRDNGVRHVLNSTRHPQANGQVERVNRTLVPAIVTGMEDVEQRDWDKRMEKTERDLNTAPNKTTGKSPFELLHGYKPRFYDGLHRYVEHENNEQWFSPEELQLEAQTAIEREKERYKARYDKGHYPAQVYDLGEVIVMKRGPVQTGEPTKTQARYRGPLVITKQLPADTYQVAQLLRENGRHYVTTAHASQLKSWKSQSEYEKEGDNEEDDQTRSETEDDQTRSETKDDRTRSETKDDRTRPETEDSEPKDSESKDSENQSTEGNESNSEPNETRERQQEATEERPKRARRAPGYLADYV